MPTSNFKQVTFGYVQQTYTVQLVIVKTQTSHLQPTASLSGNTWQSSYSWQFSRLHCSRLHRFRMAPSSVCRVCSHPVATLDHLFKRCPKARRLRLPLRRILSALYEPVLPSNVTLWSATFLPCLSRCCPASFDSNYVKVGMSYQKQIVPSNFKILYERYHATVWLY